MELLDSRQIRAFQELARQGSFTETARSLNLTQSAVSHSIKALETMLGVSLFDRLGKSVQLTRAGEILLPHVDQVLCGMQLAQEELLNLKLPGHGRLRIGSTVTLSQYVIPSVLREMRESFPAYEFSVITEDTQNLMDLLSSGSLDLVIGLESRRTNRSRFTPLFQDEISLAVSPLHPFASKSDLHETDLSGQTYIFYGQNSETYQQVSKYFQDR
ncbi:MAG: LysR family transcriptional regulator, partial [Verrucomicrobiota bacterium]